MTVSRVSAVSIAGAIGGYAPLNASLQVPATYLNGKLLKSVTTATRTSGNVTISSVGTFANVDTGIDLVITAAAGDVLEVTTNYVTAADADQLVLTCSTIVSAAVVNNLASGTSTELPVSSWCKHSTATTVPGQAGGPVSYTVQSGDISGGTVTVRLRALVGAGSVVINANSSNPLKWWAYHYV